MSSRTDLNEAALNMTKLLSFIIGLNDTQIEAVMNHGQARRLRDETLNMLRYAVQAKARARGEHTQ